MRILFFAHDLLTMPLGISYLSSIARSLGHRTDVCVLTEDDPVDLAGRFRPDVLAFSLTSGYHDRYLRLNERLKKVLPDAISVIGGPHATFFPEVIERDGVDVVVVGEGEDAFRELITCIERGADYTAVPNVWAKTRDGVARNPVRPLIQDLDRIPFPDRALYARHTRNMILKTPFVMTGRGCPYQCSYCFNHAYNRLYSFEKRIVRRRSVKNVLEELKDVLSHFPVEIFIFQDDCFILNPSWVREFCAAYGREIRKPFHCHLRANLVTSEIVQSLARAGCLSVKMAIESSDDDIRNRVLRRGMSREQMLEACRLLRESGIRLVTQNIIGNPGETLDGALETLRFNTLCRPQYAFVTLLQPYPRTDIGEYARRAGLLEGPASVPETFFARTTLRIPDRERMERLRKLFPVAVESRLVLRLLPGLLKLPLDGLWALIDKLWKGYCIKHRELPYHLSLREYFLSLRQYVASSYY
jgi:anaerobic magnesium-protoporphyrin IX monomethyl ester cyclase